MQDKETQKIKEALEKFSLEHRRLDEQIAELEKKVADHSLDLARIKKRKLKLKDQISALRTMFIPDIIA